MAFSCRYPGCTTAANSSYCDKHSEACLADGCAERFNYVIMNRNGGFCYKHAKECATSTCGNRIQGGSSICSKCENARYREQQEAARIRHEQEEAARVRREQEEAARVRREQEEAARKKKRGEIEEAEQEQRRKNQTDEERERDTIEKENHSAVKKELEQLRLKVKKFEEEAAEKKKLEEEEAARKKKREEIEEAEQEVRRKIQSDEERERETTEKVIEQVKVVTAELKSEKKKKASAATATSAAPPVTASHDDNESDVDTTTTTATHNNNTTNANVEGNFSELNGNNNKIDNSTNNVTNITQIIQSPTSSTSSASKQEEQSPGGLRRVSKKKFGCEYLDNEVGSGSTCTCYQLEFEGQDVCFKCFQSYVYNSPLVQQEIATLHRLRHSNIIEIFAIVVHKPSRSSPASCATSGEEKVVGLLCELLCGTLEDYVKTTHASISTKQKLVWLKGIASAISCCSSGNVAHGDIRPANVLLDKNLCCKLADFGSSNVIRTVTATATSVRGTAGFMAPEALRGQCTTASDVFSLAVLAWYLFHPTEDMNLGKDALTINESIKNGDRAEIDKNKCPSEVAALMEECWRQKTDARPSIGNILGRLDALIAKDGVVSF